MQSSILLDSCISAGIDFFTGVPDSLLKGLCNELYSRYGTKSDTHVVAHNEGGAIALCAGHFLATGRPGLCYMQNVKLINCELINSDLCFEFCSDIDADINSVVDSIKNPYSGRIRVQGVKELIMESNKVDISKTEIVNNYGEKIQF